MTTLPEDVAERVSFNLNNYVFVKLTKRGRRVYLEWRIAQNYRFNDIKTTGELRFQGWDLMAIFGDAMNMGSDPVFEGLNIQIQTKDLKTVRERTP